MALDQAITYKTVFGNKRVHIGTFDCSSVTGGDINTGLRSCEMFVVQGTGAAVANAPVADETFPCAGSAITIVTDSGQTGLWMAIGY